MAAKWATWRRLTGCVAVIAAALVGMVSSVGATPISAPVTATIQAKPHPQVYCEDCIRFSGRVSSPRAVCRANRTLESATTYKAGSPGAGKVYRDPHFLTTDGQGKWSVVTSSGEPLAWFEVVVARKQIGVVVCQAARAKVTL